MDRLGAIVEGWTAQSAAEERLGEYLAQNQTITHHLQMTLKMQRKG